MKYLYEKKDIADLATQLLRNRNDISTIFHSLFRFICCSTKVFRKNKSYDFIYFRENNFIMVGVK